MLIYVKEVYNTSENNTLNSIKCEALWIKIITGVVLSTWESATAAQMRPRKRLKICFRPLKKHQSNKP